MNEFELRCWTTNCRLKFNSFKVKDTGRIWIGDYSLGGMDTVKYITDYSLGGMDTVKYITDYSLGGMDNVKYITDYSGKLHGGKWTVNENLNRFTYRETQKTWKHNENNKFLIIKAEL